MLSKNSYIQIIKPNQTNLKWEVLFAFDKPNVYMYIVHQKFKIPTFNICFSTKQYPFRIHQLATQIQIAIMYQKTVLKNLMYK